MPSKTTFILALAATAFAMPQEERRRATCTPSTVTLPAITYTLDPTTVTVTQFSVSTQVTTKVSTRFSTRTATVVSATTATATATATLASVNVIGFEENLCENDAVSTDLDDTRAHQITLPIPNVPAGSPAKTIFGQCQNFDATVSSVQFDDSLPDGQTIPSTCVLRLYSQVDCRNPADADSVDLRLSADDVCRDWFDNRKSGRIVC